MSSESGVGSDGTCHCEGAWKSQRQPRAFAWHTGHTDRGEIPHCLPSFHWTAGHPGRVVAFFYWVTLPNGSGEEARDGEQLPASRLHFYTLYFFQERVVFLNNGALKSTLAPAQRITGIISYWGMEMLFLVLLDEFNHIIDGHSNLLSDVDAAARLNLRLPIGRNKGRMRRARGEG